MRRPYRVARRRYLIYRACVAVEVVALDLARLEEVRGTWVLVPAEAACLFVVA